jgi:hypothetical protein
MGSSTNRGYFNIQVCTEIGGRSYESPNPVIPVSLAKDPSVVIDTCKEITTRTVAVQATCLPLLHSVRFTKYYAFG